MVGGVTIAGMMLQTYHTDNKPRLKIGFGKADISGAGIYEDSVSVNQEPTSGDKYRQEEKFAISDRIKGRWRPGSGGIRKLNDFIYVSAMYGEDVNGPWAIITLDELILGFKLLDHLEYPLINQLGLTKERLLFLPSHGHATPKMNPDEYQKAVFEAVKQAKEKRSEVEIASLNLKLDGKKYVINRRVHAEGIGSHTVMFNDGCTIHEDYVDATDQIHEWVKNLGVDPGKYFEPGKRYVTDGEVDNNLQAIFIRDRETGELKGSFLRFAAHAVIVSAKVVNGDVSADFPGYLKNKIEDELGGIALFGQGPCGDLRPLNKEYSHAFAKEYGERLASEIIDKYNELYWEPLTKLDWYTEPVGLPLLENLFYSEEKLKEEMDKLEACYDGETDPMQRRLLQNKFWGLYRTAGVLEMVRPEWKTKKQLDVNIFALMMNDKVVMATQGEVFKQIGDEMVRPFMDKEPILVSIANEYTSYIPTDEERMKGGYEPSVSIVEPGSPERLVQSSHKLLTRIYGIKKEYCGLKDSENHKESVFRKPVLDGSIKGIETYYIELPKDGFFQFTPRQNPFSIFLITKGTGSIRQRNKHFEINEVVLFVPSVAEDISITAENGKLGILEIVMEFSVDDLYYLKKEQARFPYYITYSQCNQYKESIKSEKTINRMLLPENIVPRFCIGSVETSGPDEVGAHSHPMLEQLFFGLADNNCIVNADSQETSFEEDFLLHIPLGSEHSVKVEDGKILNYIWMDFFGSREDMDYITNNHIIVEK